MPEVQSDMLSETGMLFEINAISLSQGGPFDIFHGWGFTEKSIKAHWTHREGKQYDFTTKNMSTGQIKRWTWLSKP